MRYSVVGLGKLGASMAAAIASRGHDVIGFDVLRDHVDRINAGLAPVEETGLVELVRGCRARLRATHTVAEAVNESDLTFVVVPTPSDTRGAFQLDYVRVAFDDIGRALRDKAEPHTVVLTSTVLPGATRYALIPVLEQAAARDVGEGLGLCYSPAFIALGSVIHDFLHPDIVLIGESDHTAGDVVEQAYHEILPVKPPLRRMSLENAELTKLAVNTFVTTKISFANMLADLCERIPGGDVDVVSNALGVDRRIGRAYLTGALGYGGPCFPRDNQALSFFARSVGTSAPLAEATDAVNRALPARLADRILALIRPGSTVAVLGLAYKPATAVIEESQSLQIARAIAHAGVRVLGHDPLAGATVLASHGDAIHVMDDLRACIRAADMLLVMAPIEPYRSLQLPDLAGDGKRRVIVDVWRILDPAIETSELIEYHAIGRGVPDDATAAPLRELWAEPQDSLRAI